MCDDKARECVTDPFYELTLFISLLLECFVSTCRKLSLSLRIIRTIISINLFQTADTNFSDVTSPYHHLSLSLRNISFAHSGTANPNMT
jgi:hypothetical protein